MSILYSPENYGAELVAQIDVREPNYSFDIVAVFRCVETGRLFGAFDSGCSCPTPFEDFARLADMTPIRTVAHAKALITENTYHDDAIAGDELDFLAKVRATLRISKLNPKPWRGYAREAG